MRLKMLFTIIFLSICCFCASALSSKEKHITILNHTTFDSFISSHDVVFIEFVSENCKPCKNFDQDLYDLAESLASFENPIQTAKFDIENLHRIQNRYSVRTVPAFMILYKKEPIYFRRPPNVKEMYQWAVRRAGPPALKLESFEQINAVYTNEEVTVIFLGPEESHILKEYQKAAEYFGKKVIFVYSTDSSVRTAMGERRNSIFMIKKYEQSNEGRVNFNGSASAESIIEFVKQNMYPEIMKIDQNTIPKFVSQNRDFLVLFVKSQKDKAFKEFEKTKLELSSECSLGFVETDLIDSETKEFALMFQVTNEDFKRKKFPSLRIVQTDFFKKERNIFVYPNDEQIESEYILEWFYQFKFSKLKPFSTVELLEQIDKSDISETKMIKVTKESYKELIGQEEKEVLVNFYSSLCGTCQEFEKIWYDVAFEMNHNQRVEVAMYDIRNSGWPLDKFQAEEYPVIVFFTAKNREGLRYDGEKNSKEILLFVREHATYSFEGWLWTFLWVYMGIECWMRLLNTK